MADSTVRNKEIKKHPYKDYVNFLGNYKNGKKDDQCSDSGVSVSLTNSSNNSSSSINSDLNEQPKNFKNYLENYNNKKYHPVQPAFIKKQDKAEETKTVKTEVFIEINNAQNSVNKISKVIEINANGDNNFTISNQNGNNVSKVSKIFENKSSNESVSSKANAFKFEHNDPDANQEQKKISIGEISKKFEDMSPKSPAFVDSTKHPLKKKPSIREKSKVFEGNDNHTSKSANKLEIEIKKNICSEVSQVFKQKDDHASKLNGSVSPKPQIINAKPVLPKTESPVPAIQKSTSQNVNITTVLSPTPPPPPPPPFQPQLDVTPPPKIASPTRTLDNGPCYAPPLPPPLPPADSSPKLVNNPPKSKFSPNIHTGVNTIPKVSNGRKLDSIDGIPVPTLNKNDPRVKKIVYGALREMYGAYHDQANDYLATLPKNRVRKNNGLDSIINSIASQGGLEKLTGRVNPNVENE